MALLPLRWASSGLLPAAARQLAQRLSHNRELSSAADDSAQAPVITIIRTATDDPFFNLAFEEHMFKQHAASGEAGSNRHTLFLWRNRPCVIYGKHQNPFKELDVKAAEARGLELVRRKSGGGCVYQDLGNSIFTFISRDEPTAKDRNNALLVEALSRCGAVGAEPTGRNDIHLGGRKISGSAFMRQRGWLLHHGTMLLAVDFGALGTVLTPSKAKLQSKGVASVAARVVNLSEAVPGLDHAAFSSALAAAFLDHHTAARPRAVVEEREVGPELLARDAELRALYDGLRAWDWRFGRTPAFTHRMETRFDWGTVDVLLDCHGGAVKAAAIFSDCLQPALVEELQRALGGRRYDAASMQQAAEEAAATLGRPGQQQGAADRAVVTAQCLQFGDWLASQVAQ